MENPHPLLFPGLLQATWTLDCQLRMRSEEVGAVASAEREVFHYWSLGLLALALQGLQKLQIIKHAHVYRFREPSSPGTVWVALSCARGRLSES